MYPSWSPDELRRLKEISQGKAVVAFYDKDRALIAWAKHNGWLVDIRPRDHLRAGQIDWGGPISGDEPIDIMSYAEAVIDSPEMFEALPMLKGRVLCCDCGRQDCHGYVLADFANNTLEAQILKNTTFCILYSIYNFKM